MAERSKAPDSRSGLHMWAWVRIPFLTSFYFFFLFSLPVVMYTHLTVDTHAGVIALLNNLCTNTCPFCERSTRLG